MPKKEMYRGESGDIYPFIITQVGSDLHARMPESPGVVVFCSTSIHHGLTPMGFSASFTDMQKEFWDEAYMRPEKYSAASEMMEKMTSSGATHIGFCDERHFLHLSHDRSARIVGVLMDLRNHYNLDL